MYHISERYNDGYNAGQDYANCDYNNCDHSDHGYDTGCPNDKVHTNEFCEGYSLGYKTQWDSLAGGTSTQQSQSQSQVQGGSNVRVDGSHNNVIIAPRQSEEQSSSSSVSDSGSADYSK